MTAKRFTLNSVLNFDFGICDYGEPIGSLRNICELLNELHKEKEYWKEKYKQELEKNSIITVAYDKQGNAHILPKRVD
jgi:hypothetical protein